MRDGKGREEKEEGEGEGEEEEKERKMSELTSHELCHHGHFNSYPSILPALPPSSPPPMLQVNPGSTVLGKHATTELHLQPLGDFSDLL